MGGLGVARDLGFGALGILRILTSGRGDDTVGNPHRAQISQFELFELILSLKLDKRLPVEQSEATVSQSTVLPPLLHKRAYREWEALIQHASGSSPTICLISQNLILQRTLESPGVVLIAPGFSIF